MKHAKLTKSGFTLIELLVVVTIIGILAGLSVPALSKALDSAKRAQAAAMVSSLKVALNAYQSDYGAWPAYLISGANDVQVASYSDGDKSEDLYKMLIGKTDGDYGNPRGTVYMEFTAKQVCSNDGGAVSGGMTNASGFKDPWDGKYFIKVDGNYDNEIDVPDTTGGGASNVKIYGSMAIWSTGTTKAADGTGGNQRKYITSW